MADIAEEGRLRAIQFRQRLRAFALLFVGTRIGEAGGDLSGQQRDEAEISPHPGGSRD